MEYEEQRTERERKEEKKTEINGWLIISYKDVFMIISVGMARYNENAVSHHTGLNRCFEEKC